MILNRDLVSKAQDLKTQLVHVPEWGGDIVIRGLTAGERDDYERSIITIDGDGKRKADMANIRARLVVLAAVDDTGSRLFIDDDVPMLSRKSAAVVDRLYAVAQKLSGISAADADELEKNSGAGPSAG